MMIKQHMVVRKEQLLLVPIQFCQLLRIGPIDVDQILSSAVFGAGLLSCQTAKCKGENNMTWAGGFWPGCRF